MKLKHFSLLFSILGILLLYFLSRLSQPPEVGVHELSGYEGKKVIVVGTVTNCQTTRQGSQIIKIKENNASATIFVGGAIGICKINTKITGIEDNEGLYKEYTTTGFVFGRTIYAFGDTF